MFGLVFKCTVVVGRRQEAVVVAADAGLGGVFIGRGAGERVGGGQTQHLELERRSAHRHLPACRNGVQKGVDHFAARFVIAVCGRLIDEVVGVVPFSPPAYKTCLDAEDYVGVFLEDGLQLFDVTENLCFGGIPGRWIVAGSVTVEVAVEISEAQHGLHAGLPCIGEGCPDAVQVAVRYVLGHIVFHPELEEGDSAAFRPVALECFYGKTGRRRIEGAVGIEAPFRIREIGVVLGEVDFGKTVRVDIHGIPVMVGVGRGRVRGGDGSGTTGFGGFVSVIHGYERNSVAGTEGQSDDCG